jgi:hypothetical protein
MIPRMHRVRAIESRLNVIHAGSESFPLKENIRAIAFRHFRTEIS